mgnify:CR=1 FL=1|jgi:hypothetical protein
MEKTIFLRLIIFLLGIFITISLPNCKGSYIAGYELSPDSTHNSTIFNIIYDQDSTFHWYIKLYDGELWCYYHNKYEQVKHVRK